MQIIAHRGASFDAPENTLAAVRLGWEQRADAVEIDVHLSKDGHLVAIHDNNTRKTAGVSRKVASQTLAELRALDAGRWKGKSWAREKIPTLEEVLALTPADKRLFIEIKSGPDSVPELAKVLVQSRCDPGQIVFIGFSLQTMQTVKRMFQSIEVLWITELKRNWRTGCWTKAESLIEKARSARLDGLDLSAKGPVSSGFVKKINNAGLKLYVWTVDSPATAKKLVQAGVDGITTNRPGWLRGKLAAM